MPKLVYLDHSLVTNDPSWPSLQRLFQDSRYQLGLSIWNLLEIAAASDLAQRKARIAFLSSLKPVWLFDHVYVRKQEVKRFLCHGGSTLPRPNCCMHHICPKPRPFTPGRKPASASAWRPSLPAWPRSTSRNTSSNRRVRSPSFSRFRSTIGRNVSGGLRRRVGLLNHRNCEIADAVGTTRQTVRTWRERFCKASPGQPRRRAEMRRSAQDRRRPD
jgi:hypothetical protein